MMEIGDLRSVKFPRAHFLHKFCGGGFPGSARILLPPLSTASHRSASFRVGSSAPDFPFNNCCLRSYNSLRCDETHAQDK